MFGKVLSASVLAGVFAVSPALADLSGPAELPPSSYKGQQYVDSRGCVFLRGGYGGQVTWVPRVSRDRKQLCGYPPSGGAVAVAADVPEAKAPAAETTAVAESPKVTPAPEVETVPKVAMAEVAPKVTLPATATEKAAARAAVPAEAPVYPEAQDVTVVRTAKSGASAKYPLAEPPPGYKLAWDDDRLNPNRGKQTVEGFLAMDEIWTRTAPAELREDSKIRRKPVKIIVRHADGSETPHDGYVLSSKDGQKVVQMAATGQVLVTKSAKAAAPEAVAKTAPAKSRKPAEPAATGRFLVQVGTFGVPANAEGVAGRLKGLGLPVSRGKLKGGALTVVYAGPFASADEAKRALSAARGLGFGDARIVQ